MRARLGWRRGRLRRRSGWGQHNSDGHFPAVSLASEIRLFKRARVARNGAIFLLAKGGAIGGVAVWRTVLGWTTLVSALRTGLIRKGKGDCAPDCKQRRYLRPNQCEEVGGVDDGEAVVQAKSASVGLVAAAGEGRGS